MLNSGLLVMERRTGDLMLRAWQVSLVGKPAEIADPPNGNRGTWARFWVAASLDHGGENIPDAFWARHGSAVWVSPRYSVTEFVLPYLIPGNRVIGVYKALPSGNEDTVMMSIRQFLHVTDENDKEIMVNGVPVAELANIAPLRGVSQSPTGVALPIKPGWVETPEH